MAIIQTHPVEYEGRRYEVVVYPDRISRPVHEYCQIFRVKKDGSRGQELHSWASKGQAIRRAAQVPE